MNLKLRKLRQVFQKKERREISLKLAIEEIEKSFFLRFSHIRFVCSQSPDCENLYLMGNPDQLEKLLAQILEASFHATEGSVSPQVSLSMVKEEEQVKIEIEDNGLQVNLDIHEVAEGMRSEFNGRFETTRLADTGNLFRVELPFYVSHKEEL